MIIPQVVQIMSIIFQTSHELSIVLGNESTQKRHVSPFGSNSQGCIYLLKIIAGITSRITDTISTSGNIRSNFLKPW
jgi:hypothetical protein